MTANPIVLALVCLLLMTAVAVTLAERQPATQKVAHGGLPKPQVQGGMSLTEAIAKRRSVRQFTGQALTAEQVAQLCWAGQGISDVSRQRRTAPSAGATYPLRLYVALPEGLFVYTPATHVLEPVSGEDLRGRIAEVADQKWIARAGAVFVIAADVSITAKRYGQRAERYVLQETGHVAQNLHLQATALGLGSTPVGAYEDAKMAQVLRLPAGWQGLYVIPVGVPQ